MTTGTVYLKAEQHVQVSNPRITIGDVLKVYSGDHDLEKQVSSILLIHSKAKEDTDYMVSILKIIELITKEYPGVTIQSVGEPDLVVTIKPGPPRKKWKEYWKVLFVSAICFFGAGFSVMTFNEDSSVKDIFGYLYQTIMGQEATGPTLLHYAYSLGLPVGIIVFYNHFAGFRLQRDPTPIQTQMRLYEEDVNKTMIQNASREGNTIDAG